LALPCKTFRNADPASPYLVLQSHGDVEALSTKKKSCYITWLSYLGLHPAKALAQCITLN
jgi:hypothetical protein